MSKGKGMDMRSALVSTLVALATLFVAVPAAAQELVPLNLYYSQSRVDNYTTAIPSRQEQALNEGYRFVRTEACLFREQEPGTVPLTTFYSGPRQEHITVATDTGRGDARVAGYGILRTPEGFISPEPGPGLIPIHLYYNSLREDNYSTATDSGRSNAERDGYRQIRIEGYARPAIECAAAPQPITDSEYVIIFDRLTCEGECRLGRVDFRVVPPQGDSFARIGEDFIIDGARNYGLNFGMRFNGPGVRWGMVFEDRGPTAIQQPLTVEADGRVMLNGPQNRAFDIRLRGRGELTRITATYRVFRASP